MPQLAKMKIADLREECHQRGLVCTGLKKKQILKLLAQNDAAEAAIELDGGDGDSVLSQHVDESDDEGVTYQLNEPNRKDTEAELELKALELKFKLTEKQLELERARWEIERERLSLRAENGLPLTDAVQPQFRRDLKGLLPTMGENDQALAFFHAYEKTLLVQKVPKSSWAEWLPACLNAKASKVYMALSVEQCQDYEVVKKAVLDTFRLTSRKYLENFRNMRRTGQESYTLFLNKLREMMKYFVESKEIDSLDKLMEQMIIEQFLAGLPPFERQFVECRQPETALKAAELADLQFETQFQTVSRGRQNENRPNWRREPTATPQTEAAANNNPTAQNKSAVTVTRDV